MKPHREEGDHVKVPEEREWTADDAPEHADGFHDHPEFEVAEAAALKDF